MKEKIQVRTRTSTSTLVGVALMAGAGIMAAAGFALTAVKSTPALLVRATPTQPVNTEAVSGAEDVSVFSFDMIPHGGSAEINQIVFAVFGDSDADFSTINRDADPEDRFTQCTLQDTSGTIVAGPEPVSSGYLTFADPFALTKDVSSTYEVHCDLSNAALVDGDADRFAVSIGGEPGFDATIGGTTLSGSSLVIGKTTLDTLNAVGEVSLHVQDHGKMAVSLAKDTPPSAIFIAGESSNFVGRFELRARGEDFHVGTMTMDVIGDADAVDVLSLACGEGPDLFPHITPGYPVDGRVVFSSADCDVLSTEEYVTVDVYADLNKRDSSGGTFSGSKFQIALNAMDAGTFDAVGATSGASYTEADVSAVVSTPEMTVRESKPQFSFATSPTTSIAPGVAEVFRFNIAADSGGGVNVTQLLFKVSTTDNDASGWNVCGDGTLPRFAKASLWNLYDLALDPSVPVSDTKDWTFLKEDGRPCKGSTDPVAYAVLSLNTDATHAGFALFAGSAATYALKVDTTGASASSDDSIRIELMSEKDAFAIKQKAVVWDDTDGGMTGISGYLLNALPLTGDTMTF